MISPASRWKLGLFVVVGSLVGVFGVVYLGAQELKRSTQTAYAYFDEALTGLEEGSAVKFRGITVGRVERIRFATEDRLLEVRASLYEDYLADLGLDTSQLDASNPLIHRLRAQVVMSFVTSTAFIQVDFSEDPPGGPQMLGFRVPDDGFTLRTVPSTAKAVTQTGVSSTDAAGAARVARWAEAARAGRRGASSTMSSSASSVSSSEICSVTMPVSSSSESAKERLLSPSLCEFSEATSSARNFIESPSR